MELVFLFTSSTASSGEDVYIPLPPNVPKAGIIDISAVCNADPGDSKTFTVKSGSTTIGTFTFGTSVSAGDLATYTADTSNGKTLITGSSNGITISGPKCDAAVEVGVCIQIDEFARTT